MTRTPADHSRSARQCREALGSLHCRLQRRERLVLDALVRFSFDLGFGEAVVYSNDQFVLETGLHKSDVSLALSTLTRTGLVLSERAASLPPFRRPMLYRVMVDDLRRVSRPHAGQRSLRAEAVRAASAAWLVHANQCYPLQPELLPPDPNEFAEALAEISRTSALADDHPQNEEPKPGHDAREAYSSEPVARPGRADPTAHPQAGSDRPPDDLDPAHVRHLMAESMANAGHPHPAAGGSGPVDDSQTRVTGMPPSLRSSNQPHARKIRMSDDSRDLLSSGHPDEAAPVCESQTGGGARPPLAAAAAMLLSRYGEEWTPPTRGEAVFAELLECMGPAVMANYTPWWLPRCLDPETRIDVLEAIATWKLKRHGRRHKPWRGGNWRDEFHRRQRERLEAAEQGRATV